MFTNRLLLFIHSPTLYTADASSTSAPTSNVGSGGPRSITEVLADEQLVINVEGPYGLSIADCINQKGYTHLLFVGGGIGVTPLHSCLRQLYVTAKACRFKPEKLPVDDKSTGSAAAAGQQAYRERHEGESAGGLSFDIRRDDDKDGDEYLYNDPVSDEELPAYPYPKLQNVKLLWAVKTPQQAGVENLFADTFDLISMDNIKGMFEVAVHVTGHEKVKEQAETLGLEAVITSKQKAYGANKSIQIKIGRPELEEEVKQLQEHKMKALLFVCGPESMVEDCANLTMQYGIDFRHETFEL